ncbi:ADP-sugar pyrophosphatase-like [Oppia nitens]|uniref:ADP-sugar pyrophosphatase-like n=1 Tax=Oppia nitens TaxID=1686743 RepID=UPI0023DC151F|nr:ADP-sugar pyrophosphatase-like [Oppia nitens]
MSIINTSSQSIVVDSSDIDNNNKKSSSAAAPTPTPAPTSTTNMTEVLLHMPTMRKMSDISIDDRCWDTSLFKPLSEKLLFTGKSLQLSKYTFEDDSGNRKSAEIIRKKYTIGNNQQSTEDTVSVLSIAILRQHIRCDCLLLIKQYRPTLKAYALEFPAKIVEHTAIDEKSDEESDEETGEVAIEDIENNTGYKSTDIHHISPETALDPELCDGKVRLVSLVVDGDDPIKNGFINGHHNEKHTEIEVHQVPINGLLDRLNEYSKRGIVVDSRVYAFAIGLKKGEKLAQIQAKMQDFESVS